MKIASSITILLLVSSVFFLSLTFLPTKIGANTLYVGGVGPGNHTTIQSAIDLASPGDIIYVYGGTYYENVKVNKTVSLNGENRYTTIINGNSSGDVMNVTASWVNVTGFTITNSGTDWYDAGLEFYSTENCYVADTIITNNSHGILLTLSNDSEIANSTFSHNRDGLRLHQSGSNTIVGNNASFNANGMLLSNSSSNTIVNNIAHSNTWYDIYIYLSSSNSIVGNTMVEGGIYVWGPLLEHWNTHIIDTSNTVNGKPVYYWKNVTGGIVPPGAGQVILANTSGVKVENQDLGNGSVSIELGFSSNNTVTNNSASSNNVNGIYLWSANNNTIENNTLLTNGWNGLYLYSSSNNTITENVARNNTYAIYLTSSSDNIISNNIVQNNTYGIHSESSRKTTIAGNNASSNRHYGISLVDSDNNTIANNNASLNNWDGLYLHSSGSNIIADNSFSWNYYYGVSLHYSSCNTIGDNVISNNWIGVYIDSSVKDTLVNNDMIYDGIYVWGPLLEHWNTHIIDTSNTVNGKPVYYWKNVTGGIVPPGAGQVILANTSGVKVENQDLGNGSVSIELGFSTDNRIMENNASLNDYLGIYLHSSDNNTIMKSTASMNEWYGIRLYRSSNNTLANVNTNTNGRIGIYLWSANSNMIIDTHASMNNEDGIYLDYSHNNTLSRNNVSSNNETGVYIWGADDNIIGENTVISNSLDGISIEYADNNSVLSNELSLNKGTGIELHQSNGNRIYHNDITNNANQASDDSDTNRWHNGYPSGGNYWSDYTGIDNCSGPNQDVCPDIDGIGDTPYGIDADSEDVYPLMFPFGTELPRPPMILQASLSGRDLENVTVFWSLSADDGSGFKSVAGYKIFRNITYDPGGLDYLLIASLPNGTSEYVDTLVGDRNPNDYFYKVCAIDLYNNTTCAKVQAAKFTRPLSKGAHLLSVPLVQSNESTLTVLQTLKWDKAWTYDSSARKWKSSMMSKPYKGELDEVNISMAIWVNITEQSNLTVAGIVPSTTSIHLHAGWNLVGFPSFNATYAVSDLKASVGLERIEGFDALTPPYFLRAMTNGEVFQAGYGYWVKVADETIWVVTSS